MRYDGFSSGFSALVLAGAVLVGCGGRDELAVSGSDACPLPRRTPVASFVLTGDDGRGRVRSHRAASCSAAERCGIRSPLTTLHRGMMASSPATPLFAWLPIRIAST
jgi:hypothetical protein